MRKQSPAKMEKWEILADGGVHKLGNTLTAGSFNCFWNISTSSLRNFGLIRGGIENYSSFFPFVVYLSVRLPAVLPAYLPGWVSLFLSRCHRSSATWPSSVCMDRSYMDRCLHRQTDGQGGQKYKDSNFWDKIFDWSLNLHIERDLIASHSSPQPRITKLIKSYWTQKFFHLRILSHFFYRFYVLQASTHVHEHPRIAVASQEHFFNPIQFTFIL